MSVVDMDGKMIAAGDTIVFSYGIPGVRVEAKVALLNGRLWAMTPGHTPDKCRLDELAKYVGVFWKLGKKHIQ